MEDNTESWNIHNPDGSGKRDPSVGCVVGQ